MFYVFISGQSSLLLLILRQNMSILELLKKNGQGMTGVADRAVFSYRIYHEDHRQFIKDLKETKFREDVVSILN